MLYLVPDIEKAVCEIKRVLTKGGVFYVTTNSNEAMAELNELVKSLILSLGYIIMVCVIDLIWKMDILCLKNILSEIRLDLFEGKIIVDTAEPVVSYKASTIKGNSMLTGEKRQEFTRYVEEYIKEKGNYQ